MAHVRHGVERDLMFTVIRTSDKPDRVILNESELQADDWSYAVAAEEVSLRIPLTSGDLITLQCGCIVWRYRFSGTGFVEGR